MANEPIQSAHIAEPDPDAESANAAVREHLEALVEINTDAADGFETARDSLEDSSAASLFATLGAERRGFIEELQRVAEPFGGVARGGSVLGAVHRAWISIKDTLTSGDHAILEAAATGEAHAVETYTDALAADLPPQVQAVIRRQADAVESARDRVEGLVRSTDR